MMHDKRVWGIVPKTVDDMVETLTRFRTMVLCTGFKVEAHDQQFLI